MHYSALAHSAEHGERERVRDLSLRAIQISCTPFHPPRRLSLALSSLWMSVVALFSQLYLQPPFILDFFSSARDGAFLSFCTSQKTFSLWTSVSAWLFSILCFYSPACFSLIFPSSAHMRWGHFTSPSSSVSGTGGTPACDCVSARHVCLKIAIQFGSILDNIQQLSRFIRRSVVCGSTPVPAHFPSRSPLFTPFHTQSNACHGKRK